MDEIPTTPSRGRRIAAVLGGLVVANITIFAIEAVGHQVYPPPSGLDFNDREAVAAFVTSMPLGAFLFILLAYADGSLTGGLVATLIVRRTSTTPALIVGGILTVLGAMNVLMIPHPVWFAVVSMLLYLPLAWLGARLMLRGAAVRTP